jgi:hypothetical protein
LDDVRALDIDFFRAVDLPNPSLCDTKHADIQGLQKKCGECGGMHRSLRLFSFEIFVTPSPKCGEHLYNKRKAGPQ